MRVDHEILWFWCNISRNLQPWDILILVQSVTNIFKYSIIQILLIRIICGSGVISHEIWEYEILWSFSNIPFNLKLWDIVIFQLNHSDQTDQSGYTSASSDRFRSCFVFPTITQHSDVVDPIWVAPWESWRPDDSKNVWLIGVRSFWTGVIAAQSQQSLKFLTRHRK